MLVIQTKGHPAFAVDLRMVLDPFKLFASVRNDHTMAPKCLPQDACYVAVQLVDQVTRHRLTAIRLVPTAESVNQCFSTFVATTR